MVPFYMMNIETPLPFAFDYVNLDWCKYIATVGAIISLSTWLGRHKNYLINILKTTLISLINFSLYSGMFPMPRIVYTMACDGLIFKPFAAVLPKLKTPWVASLVTGIIGGQLIYF